ncbi:hypothetical protein Hanom_Chr11g01026771 [Helianthus anomalus]
MLWSKEIGQKIEETIGKVVYQDKMNLNSGILNEARLGVLVNSSKEIKEEVKIIFRGQEYKVWISELSGIWAPEFIPGRCLILNEIHYNWESENLDTKMNEKIPTEEMGSPIKVVDSPTESVDIPAEMGEVPVEKVVGGREDEKVGNQKVREEESTAGTEGSQGRLVFRENWERLFGNGNEDNRHEGNKVENGGLGKSNLGFKDVIENNNFGLVDIEGFMAQKKKYSKGKSCKGRRPKINSMDILGQAFKNKKIIMPDLNTDIVDPPDPFQVEDLIWKINPITKSVKRKIGVKKQGILKSIKGQIYHI